nr:glycoside hydrolase family 2 TIM barrel-domain containing protein [uncultured Pedobacter sp.]
MKITIKILSILLLANVLMSACSPKVAKNQKPREKWTVEQANNWYKQWGWLRGANFIPSTAINQLEMWQAATFDPATIDRELGYAEGIGMNSMRVYLHHIAWQQDPKGFKKSVNQYLAIADKHQISTILVFFDDCWNAEYKAGKQPAPKPGIHNSGWLKDPGNRIYREPKLTNTLETYVKDVLTSFKNDKRIVMWDLYNEPGGQGIGNKSMPLLQKVFAWARTINPSQPLTAGVWNWDLKELSAWQITNSDVVTYHNYGNEVDHQKTIDAFKNKYKGPLICTEYMARNNGSKFFNIMPILKKQNIGAYNWGLVAGKTNTVYKWDTPIPSGEEPEIWFHDIFRKDGTPYSQAEVDLIKSLSLQLSNKEQ